MDSLIEYMKKNDIPYAIIANLQSGVIENLGDISALEHTGLIKGLFYDLDTIHNLNQSLDGQILPRIWGQGNVRCIVCKPYEGIIIGLFCKEEMSLYDFYMWTKKVDEDIHKIITSATDS
jgi:hypothetical protein